MFGLSTKQWQDLVLSVNVHRNDRRLRPSEVAAALDLALKQTDVDTLAQELGFKEPSTMRKIHSLVRLSPALAATVEWGTRRGGISMSTASELLLLNDPKHVEEGMKAALELDMTRTEAQQLKQIYRRTKASIKDCVQRVMSSRTLIERSELVLGTLVTPEAREIQSHLGDEEASRRLRLRLASLHPNVTLKSLRIKGHQFSLLLLEEDAAKLRAAIGSKSIENFLTDVLASIPLQV